MAAILLDKGANVAAPTKRGFTPLHLAAKYGHVKVAKLFISKEAPVNAEGKVSLNYEFGLWSVKVPIYVLLLSVLGH